MFRSVSDLSKSSTCLTLNKKSVFGTQRIEEPKNELMSNIPQKAVPYKNIFDPYAVNIS